MTNDDMHGAEHNPHGDEFEHQQADENWSGGAPVDDFGGEDESISASVSEEAEDAGEAGHELDQDVPVESVDAPRKSRKILPTIIVVVGMAAVAGMGYFQFQPLIKNILNGSRPSQIAHNNVPPVPQPAAAPKTAMIPLPGPSTDNGNAATQGVATPTAASAAFAEHATVGSSTVVASGGSSALPFPAPAAPSSENALAPASVNSANIAPSTPEAAAPIPSPTSMPAPAPATKTAAAPAPAPVLLPSVTSAPVPAPVMMPAAAPAPVVPATPPSVQDDTRLTALASRVDDLQKSMTKATQQLSAISDKLSAQVNTPAVSVNSPALEDRLNKIEQKLTQMQADRSPAPAVPVSTADSSAMSLPADTVPVVKPVDEEKPVPASAPKVAHSHKKAVASRHSQTVTAASGSKWVLRAASEDQAWIAKDSTTSNLKPVQVGDDVVGIGHVNAIHEIADGWEIVGTKGTIH